MFLHLGLLFRFSPQLLYSTQESIFFMIMPRFEKEGELCQGFDTYSIINVDTFLAFSYLFCHPDDA